MRYLWLAGLMVLASCAPSSAPTEASVAVNADPTLRLQRESGGTLAFALLDDQGAMVAGYHAHSAFAFCSSFKVALAGVAFEKARAGAIDLDAPIKISRDDFPGYQPVMQAKWEAGETTTLREAIDATVTTSDNMAANLLIDAIGGPDAVTRQWRAWGDEDSWLTRRETALNENALSDLRDTSSPRAMADMMRRLISGDLLPQDDADQLARLTHKATTGLDRVRAGLPEGWSAGDKTGTCKPEGQPDQQVNDVGWFRGADGRLYWFAVMLARPTVSSAEAKAIHAEMGRYFARLVD